MNETTASGIDPSPSVVSLLALSDEVFVRAAYLAILGREADPDGLTNYVGQLRTGEPKAQIVAALARSAEGQRRAAVLTGLAELVARPARPAYSIWARLFKRLTAAAVEPVLQQLRIIDNTAAQINASLQRQSEQLAEVVRLLKQGNDATSPSLDLASGEPAATGRTVQTSRLSPSLGRLFSELKAAVAVKRGH